MEDFKLESLNAIEAGIKKGKRVRKVQKILYSKLSIFMICFFAFTTAVNVSSAFANALIEIPVIGEIVDFVRIGSGYEKAVEHGYFEHGDVLVDNDQYKLTVEGYYFSDYNINVIFKLESDEEGEWFNYYYMELYDEEMNVINNGMLSYGPLIIDDGEAVSQFDFIYKGEGVLPDQLTMHFDLTKQTRKEEVVAVEVADEHQSPEYDSQVVFEDLEFKIEKKIKDQEVKVTIDENFKKSDMQFEIKDLLITPTTMNLEIDVDSETMEFYDFETIYFESRNEKYQLISNGTSRSGDNSMGYTYYFETSYFELEESLALVIEGINALPKSNATVKVDLNQGIMLTNIDDHMVLTEVKETTDAYYVHFEGEINEKISFSTYNGNYFMEVGTSNSENSREYFVKVDKDKLEGPVIEIDFGAYPNILELKKEIVIEK